MVIDGKAIAASILSDVQKEIAQMDTPPRLTVFTCAPNFETQKFLTLKQKRADEVGVHMEVVTLNSAIPTIEILRIIEECLLSTDGIIVQLPFPPTVDVKTILDAIPAKFDVDAMNYDGEETLVLPPVVGAIDVIAKQFNVTWKDAHVVVVGQGRLVGAPAALYAQSRGARVDVLALDTQNNEEKIKTADILILGTGVPGLITPNMVKNGVLVFDAGTSEEGGMLVGDASPEVAQKADLFTPVPGGIGPITIAILLKNVLQLAQSHGKKDANML